MQKISDKIRIGKTAKKILLILAKSGQSFLEHLFWLAYPKRIGFEQYEDMIYGPFYRSARRLESYGLLKRRRQGKRITFILTRQGLNYAKNLELLDVKIIRLKIWDGIWRFVIFDIPEKHRVVREVLRKKLKMLGFVQIQKSVFAIPWPCQAQIRRIQNIYNADKFIKYLEVNAFDGEKLLKQKFKV